MKSLAEMIIGSPEDDHIHELEGDITGPPIDPGMMMAAEEILEAIDKKDAHALCKALDSFHELKDHEQLEEELEESEEELFGDDESEGY